MSSDSTVQSSSIRTVDQDILEDMNDITSSVSQESTSRDKIKRPPRSERKRRRHQELLLEKRESRKQKKKERKERLKEENTYQLSVDDEEHISKRDVCRQKRERLQDAMKTGQRICIDVSLESHMTDKELGKLSLQICRLYGCNRRSTKPAHIYLTGMDKTTSRLYQQCVRKNSGFNNYLIDVERGRHSEIFPHSDIVYLSPDSQNVLTDIDPDKVYVIGGLVDESVKKNITETQALSDGIATARLPIQEYMQKVEQDSHSTVLAVNQVFEILLLYSETQDWSKALSAGVPRRKGYIPKDVHKS